ncbi:hypothetical protein Q9295_03815 [Xinfangfangia sp. CPCC 101601]|uniref:Secreted protein n=1 Tax=Pseudogemmobacter lacusdianii TaxID=3069608 RepID=A0ABU0VVE0_9RHOB|nr:hypothetical protein [Xinfangfangia sp. CPCC 101601]MDQ2065488.1 hypothetical protein [Xinfangfangia sp. CPCC 101601]
MRIEPGFWLSGSFALAMVCTPAGAQRGDPLSAIDWLSQSVTTPAKGTVSAAPKGRLSAPPVESGAARAPERNPNEPPVSRSGALPVAVATTSLDGPTPDAVGLISPAVSGFPKRIWGVGLTVEVAQAVTRDRMDSLPQQRQLLLTLLLAEAAAPIDSGGKGVLLQARVDKLLQLGALEQAAALIELADQAQSPDLFRRAFDVALLTGHEDRACERMMQNPSLAPTLQGRVFCLARSGEWDAAAVTLQTAEALGQVDHDQAGLMGRFLDPDLYEGEPVPRPPMPVTPLDWKMFEGIGEPLSTANLPVAFAYAEINPNFGWKAQIEAAERLTAAGTIAPNVILGLYTERSPSASGGVWERVAAFQDFDNAFGAQDRDKIEQSLPVVWARMQEVELEVAFAMLYGPALAAMDLPGEAGEIAFRIGLLSPDYQAVARNHQPHDAHEAFLIALALGELQGVVPPDRLARAIAPAFTTPQPSANAQALLDGDRLGEAILAAIDEISDGVQGNLRGVTEGLSLFRKVQLEETARRTALELMLLERRG